MNRLSRRHAWLALLAFCVLIPTIFQLGHFAWTMNKRLNDAVFHLNVRGYDPRDPVRGRYVTLQIDWKTDDRSSECPLPKQRQYSPIKSCGLCLINQHGETRTVLIPRSTFTQHKCQKTITRISATGDTLHINRAGNHTFRVYLPEAIADQVDDALRHDTIRFSADISFTPDDQPILRALYADGQPYQDVFKRK